jgi:hypothetical protein
LIILSIFGEMVKLWNPSLSNFSSLPSLVPS